MTAEVCMIIIKRNRLQGESPMGEVEALRLGMIAPNFTLKDDNAVERSLHDYLGKKNVVLAFYPKDFTGG